MRSTIAFAFAFAFAGLALCANAPVHAQDSPCRPSVAATVVTQDYRVVRGLQKSHFQADLGKGNAAIAVAPDTAPRRIVVLLDVGRKVTNDAWKLAITLVERVVANARPEDAFALLTFGGPEVAVPFGQPRDAVLSRLAALVADRPKPALEGSRGYDAALRALQELGAPQFGDAIFMVAGGADTHSRATLGRTLAALQANGARLFGFTLTRFTALSVGPIESEERLQTDQGTRDLARLATESGGVLFAENTTPFNRPFVITEAKLESLHTLAWRMYSQIADVYRIEFADGLRESVGRWKLQVADDIRNKVPGVAVQYPSRLSPCPAPTAPTP